MTWDQKQMLAYLKHSAGKVSETYRGASSFSKDCDTAVTAIIVRIVLPVSYSSL